MSEKLMIFGTDVFIKPRLRYVHFSLFRFGVVSIFCNCIVFIAGYGFVDFENDVCAENAVKGLQAKGIQAQMAKVGISSIIRRTANVSS